MKQNLSWTFRTTAMRPYFLAIDTQQTVDRSATIDRLLRIDRKKVRPHGRCTTRPGSILLHQIPIKTFSQWDDTQPGYFAMDWVACAVNPFKATLFMCSA